VTEIWDSLKDSSSLNVLERLATQPPPLALLNATREGRIVTDGMQRGVIGLTSAIAGTPRDLFEYTRRQVTGFERAEPKDARPGTSDWFEKKLTAVYEDRREALYGDRRPETRSPAEKYLHLGAEALSLVGSFFIPGVGSTTLARLGPLGTIFGRAGTQMNLAGAVSAVHDLVDELRGKTYPVEPAAEGKTAPVPHSAPPSPSR